MMNNRTSNNFAYYAAADAWGTYMAYVWFREFGIHDSPPTPNLKTVKTSKKQRSSTTIRRAPPSSSDSDEEDCSMFPGAKLDQGSWL